jgi:hypothetical protein
MPTKYFESYISLTLGGIARVWVNKRKNDRVLIEVKYVEQDIKEATDYLNKQGIAFATRGTKGLSFNVNLQQLKDKRAVHEWIAQKLAPSYLTQATSQAG